MTARSVGPAIDEGPQPGRPEDVRIWVKADLPPLIYGVRFLFNSSPSPIWTHRVRAGIADLRDHQAANEEPAGVEAAGS